VQVRHGTLVSSEPLLCEACDVLRTRRTRYPSHNGGRAAKRALSRGVTSESARLAKGATGPAVGTRVQSLHLTRALCSSNPACLGGGDKSSPRQQEWLLRAPLWRGRPRWTLDEVEPGSRRSSSRERHDPSRRRQRRPPLTSRSCACRRVRIPRTRPGPRQAVPE
jgi:hypothetical protein